MTDIFDLVRDYKRIGIGAHIRPDGDAIGSCLALYFYLKKRLPEADIYVYLEKPDSSFDIVPGVQFLGDYSCPEEKLDVFIMLDTISSRLGKAEPYFDAAQFKVNIDHHISNKGGVCQYECIVPEAAATAELVYKHMNPDFIDNDIAELLYLGISHDTGNFRFNNTKPETMNIISNLIEYDFDFSRLIDVTYYEKTYKQIIVQAKVILESQLYHDGVFIVGVAKRDMVVENGAVKDDFDGVVNRLLETKGVEAALFVFERPEGGIKLSLRACTDRIDVSKIAMEFGGGGHIRAAGCDCDGDTEQLIERIVASVANQL